jgi:hypothetical protein
MCEAAVQRFKADGAAVFRHFVINRLAVRSAGPWRFAVGGGFDLRCGGIRPVGGDALQGLQFRAGELGGIELGVERKETEFG